MIKIIEHGQTPLTNNKKYIAVCDNCGCKFVFETRDMYSRERRLGIHGGVVCPEEGCNKIVRIDDPMEAIEEEIKNE